jgi:hypothetical protein
MRKAHEKINNSERQKERKQKGPDRKSNYSERQILQK